MGDQMTREQELVEEFKAGLSPDDVPQLAARIAGLEKQNADLSLQLDQHEDEGASYDDEFRKLHEQLDASEKRAQDAEARADRAEAATKRAKAKVAHGDAPPKPRKLGMPKDPVDIDRDALRAALADAEKIEIGFSDGKAEVAGIAPLTVEGDVWKEHTLGLMLRDPVTITGPAGGSSVSVAGYALLLDGKQAAYTERSDPLIIAPGQRISLADDIYFG